MTIHFIITTNNIIPSLCYAFIKIFNYETHMFSIFCILFITQGNC